MVGFLANHLILRIQVDGQDSFSSLLTRVEMELRLAYQHFDFGRIMHLYPERISEFLFNWIATDWMGISAQQRPTGDSELSFRPFQVHTSWPVTFNPFFSHTSSGVTATVAYRTDLFSKTTVDQFGANIRRFAAECGRDPLIVVSAISLDPK
jgi:hypothetical protein